MAFAVIDSHLVISSEKTVEKSIRILNSSEQSGLETKKWFRVAKSKVPSQSGFVSLKNHVEEMEYLWFVFKNLPKLDKDKNPDRIKVELLPDYNAVKKYFGLYIGHGNSKNEGVFVDSLYVPFKEE